MKKIKLSHVAISYNDKEKADIFFTKILNLSIQKSFNLTSDLSEKIFGIKKDIDIIVYGDENIQFEVFINKSFDNKGYNHICIEVENKQQFIDSCLRYDLKPFIVKKGEKNLLFTRDFSGNLYEIKEKP